MNWNEIIRRYSFGILLLIVLFELLLFKSDLISAENMKYGLLIPAVLELLFFTILFVNMSKIIKNYKKLKKEGWEAIDAWQKSLELVVSPRIARLATIELRLYYALYLSYRKKPNNQDQKQFSNRKNSFFFLVRVLIILCFIEITAVTILIPNRWLVWKAVHLVLGLWAIMWMWADYRSIELYNHLITPNGIKFRLGLRYSQFVPWDNISTVCSIYQAPPDGSMTPRVPKKQPGLYYMGIGEICNIEITLKEPQSFQAMIYDIKDVKILLLSLDKPNQFLDTIRTLNPDLSSPKYN